MTFTLEEIVLAYTEYLKGMPQVVTYSKDSPEKILEGLTASMPKMDFLAYLVNWKKCKDNPPVMATPSPRPVSNGNSGPLKPVAPFPGIGDSRMKG